MFPPSTVNTAPVVFFEIARWKNALATSSAFTSLDNINFWYISALASPLPINIFQDSCSPLLNAPTSNLPFAEKVLGLVGAAVSMIDIILVCWKMAWSLSWDSSKFMDESTRK